MSDSTLQIDMSARWGEFRMAVSGTLDMDGVTGVFGSSGSGKTSLLRILAGLDTPDAGTLRFGGETWFESAAGINVPAHERPVGMVFQGGRLLPHLDVRAQLEFARRRGRKSASTPRIDDVVTAMGLAPLLEHQTDFLSGGERQRVAIGLALLTGPELLLLDEPMSGLDDERKSRILPFLKTLRSAFGIPLIYVTHDTREMSRLADRVLVMAEGRVAAYGETLPVLNQFGFGGLDSADRGVLMAGEVVGLDPAKGIMRVRSGEQALHVPLQDGAAIGDTIRLLVYARDVAISLQSPEQISIQNILPGRITAIRDSGTNGSVHVDIDIGPVTLCAEITQSARLALSLWEGQTAFALVKAMQLVG